MILAAAIYKIIKKLLLKIIILLIVDFLNGKVIRFTMEEKYFFLAIDASKPIKLIEMKKTFCLVFIVLIFSNSSKIYAYPGFAKYYNCNTALNPSTISIKDLISLKNYSNEQIHDYLILKDWIYV